VEVFFLGKIMDSAKGEDYFDWDIKITSNGGMKGQAMLALLGNGYKVVEDNNTEIYLIENFDGN
jgi:hypothetical protein